MDLFSLYKKFNQLPVAHQSLLSMLNGYSNPNDKIHQLLKQKKLIPLRRGLYILNPEITNQNPSLILLANHIYGPSYVSLDFALQYYGAIPERVFEVSSVTIKKSTRFLNESGLFTYSHITNNYYPLGISTTELPGNFSGLMARPEKALLDKLITSTGIFIRSIHDAEHLLLEDWRISSHWLSSLDLKWIESRMNHTPKRKSIEMMIKFLKQL